jgi:hypothetical protein
MSLSDLTVSNPQYITDFKEFSCPQNLDFLQSADSYNETKIKDKILKTGKKIFLVFLMIAIQLAVVGFGNKNLGSIRQGDQTVDIRKFLESNGVKTTNTLNSKLADDDLTPRRLMRFFRKFIQEAILKFKRASYLYLKYSRRDEKFVGICFPGAEHWVETKEDADYLLETYKKLDSIHSSTLEEKIRRVLVARRIDHSN